MWGGVWGALWWFFVAAVNLVPGLLIFFMVALYFEIDIRHYLPDFKNWDIRIPPLYGRWNRAKNVTIPHRLDNSKTGEIREEDEIRQIKAKIKHVNFLDIDWQDVATRRAPVVDMEEGEGYVEFASHLRQVAHFLSTCAVVGVDIEQHGRRSYQGVTCLVQLSGGGRDFVVDALALRNKMTQLLGPLFENPKILKVFHGSDNDLMWLQRDFGIRAINIFDTQRACRILGAPYENLLGHWETFCGCRMATRVKREYQTRDWTERPLTQDQIEYARLDSHFLPFIASCLIAIAAVGDALKKWPSSDGSKPSVAEDGKIPDVLLVKAATASGVPVEWMRKITERMKREEPTRDLGCERLHGEAAAGESTLPPWTLWSAVSDLGVRGCGVKRRKGVEEGYVEQLKSDFRRQMNREYAVPTEASKGLCAREFRRCIKHELDLEDAYEVHERFERLFVCRDRLARRCDESPHYILPTRLMFRIARERPQSVSEFEAVVNAFLRTLPSHEAVDDDAWRQREVVEGDGEDEQEEDEVKDDEEEKSLTKEAAETTDVEPCDPDVPPKLLNLDAIHDDHKPHLITGQVQQLLVAMADETLGTRNHRATKTTPAKDLESDAAYQEMLAQLPETMKAKLATIPPEKRLRHIHFAFRFAAKSAVYENCEIYAPDGELLCHCDRRKIRWYLAKHLATPMDDEPPEDPTRIRLRFEPNGRSLHSVVPLPDKVLDEGVDNSQAMPAELLTPEELEQWRADLFYVSKKMNRCVVCGSEKNFLRFHVVPACYRQYFPTEYKSHGSHDVVLLCVVCHEEANRKFHALRIQLATEYNAPLRRDIEKTNKHESLKAAQRAAVALTKGSAGMPDERIRELKEKLVRWDMRDVEKLEVAEIGTRALARMSQAAHRILFEEEPALSYEGIEKRLSVWMCKKKRRAESEEEEKDVGMKHGELVVSRLEDIAAFVRRCRQYFVDHMKPQCLPANWNINHKVTRSFGPHSRFSENNRVNAQGAKRGGSANGRVNENLSSGSRQTRLHNTHE